MMVSILSMNVREFTEMRDEIREILKDQTKLEFGKVKKITAQILETFTYHTINF